MPTLDRRLCQLEAATAGVRPYGFTDAQLVGHISAMKPRDFEAFKNAMPLSDIEACISHLTAISHTPEANHPIHA